VKIGTFLFIVRWLAAQGINGVVHMNASFDIPPQGDLAGRHTILIVEDEVLVRLDIASYLRSRDFTVLEAGTAQEAIELLNADPNIDLVFSDVSMPGSLNGIELARWIRASKSRVRVLLTSGTADNIQIASRENVVVEKPYHPSDVEMNIRRLLGT
jgi:CheY-like chemotaxis protein